MYIELGEHYDACIKRICRTKNTTNPPPEKIFGNHGTQTLQAKIDSVLSSLRAPVQNSLVADGSHQGFGDLNGDLLLEVLGGVAQHEGVGACVGPPA